MQLTNTTNNYGIVAKWLHWLTAVLFLCSYGTVYFRHWFTEKETTANWIALQLHLSVGVTIAVIVILRIIWRLSNKKPNPEAGTRIQHFAIRIGHYALYVIMIVMPLTGYIGTGVNTEYFLMFDIAKFESTAIFTSVVNNGLGMTFKELEKPVDFIHKELLGEYLVWMLIAGHVLAALYHHFIKKDRTLYKMTSSQ